MNSEPINYLFSGNEKYIILKIIVDSWGSNGLICGSLIGPSRKWKTSLTKLKMKNGVWFGNWER